MDAMGKSQENNNNITDLDIHQTLTPSETKHPHESQHMFSRKKQQKKINRQGGIWFIHKFYPYSFILKTK